MLAFPFLILLLTAGKCGGSAAHQPAAPPPVEAAASAEQPEVIEPEPASPIVLLPPAAPGEVEPIGDPAIRLTKLQEEIRSDKSEYTLRSVEFSPQHAVLVPDIENLLKEPHSGLRCEAALALWKITGKTERAAAVLREELDGEEARRAAVYLWTITGESEPAVEVLRAAFKKGDYAAVYWVGPDLGTRAAGLKNDLLPLLDHAGCYDRVHAFHAVWAVTRDAALVLPTIKSCLTSTEITPESDDFSCSVYAAAAAAHLGPALAPLIPELRAMLHGSPYGDGAGDAATALAEIGDAAKVALPDLREFLEDGGRIPYDDVQVAHAIYRLSGEYETTLPIIVAGTEDTESMNDASGLALIFLDEMVPELAKLEAKEALRVFKVLLRDRSPEVRARGARGIRLLGEAGRGAVPDLQYLFNREQGDTQYEVARALALLDTEYPESYYQHVRFNNDEDGFLAAQRIDVATEQPEDYGSIIYMRNAGEQGLKFLREDLSSKDENDQICGLRAATVIGPAAAGAAPQVRALLDSGNSTVSSAAKVALKAIGALE